MKTRITVFGLLAILLCTSGMAQQTPPSGNKTLLWRISGKGLAKPSYLFGAMDYVCPADYFWTKNMQDCLAHCEKVCFSLNLADAALKNEVAQYLKDEHKQLKDYFTSAEYPQVKQFVQSNMHLDLDQPKVQHLKPLAIQPYIAKYLLGCADPVSYDLRIMESAKNAGKNILGIETAKEFISDMETTRFNDKVAQILAEIVSGSTYYHNYRNSIERAYQHQDIQQINNLFKGTKHFSKVDFKTFLDEHSKRYATRMPAMMQQSSVFFTINPVNLWGDEGVISLLKKAGYSVEPVY